jgi:hypothetical protein
VTVDTDSHGPVGLTTSIQPHYQFRRATDLPDHFGIALRVAGPLLALGVNSPFLPPGLYDDPGPDRDLLLREGWVENRVPVYEGMMNPPDGPAKVRFPEDIDTPEEAVHRAQRAYIDRQAESLLTGTLTDWPDPRPAYTGRRKP